MIYEGSTDSYLVGIYNGHTVDVERCEAGELKRPGVFCHATSFEAASAILREGLRAMGRNDIHCVPLHMSARQESYLKPSPRKTHIVTVGGLTASAAGIKFFLLGNGVVVSRGINGLLPPCCITGLWANTNAGRRSLSMDAAMDRPPRVVPVTTMPDHGPPVRVQGYVATPQQKATLTPRRTPPREEDLHVDDRIEQAHAMLEYWSERVAYLRRRKDLQEVLQQEGP